MKARLAIALSFFLLPALLLFVNNSSRANANPRPHTAECTIVIRDQTCPAALS